jgi:glycosyltransferase involved in cell wall biosynthesis
MRIAALAWTDRRAGGLEGYLAHVLPALAAEGHAVSLWHEVSEPASRPRLAPEGAIDSHQCGSDAVERLQAWAPDVVLGNGLSHPALERALHAAAPSVFVAHNYHGTCISGTKCWARPVARPCTRTFGPGCLIHYYPNRCGGLSPLTMARMYGAARQRLDTIRTCRRVVTLSGHMRGEYVAHGVDESRVVVVPYGPPAPAKVPSQGVRGGVGARLVFVGRLEPLKGVDLLLEALPVVARRSGRPVHLDVIGDGAGRALVETDAHRVQAAAEGTVSVTFAGWQSPAERDRIVAAADLFVMPGPWPEPFGIAGLEAAHLGVPAVAFDVGGISEWLRDGESGRLAQSSPPSPDTLADAITDALAEPVRLAAMGAHAREIARSRSPEAHARELAAVCTSALAAPRPS